VASRLPAAVRFTLLVVATLAASPLPAAAQIYIQTDPSGRQVWSDREINQPTAVYAVPGTPQSFSTTPVADATRVSEFDSLIVQHAARHALRPELVRAVIQVESGFNPRAVSPKGAMGLMQLMPATARELGVRDAYDPGQNISGGTAYLRQLLDRYDGNEELALAAYNAGSGAVDRSGGRVPAYRETRDYVRKVNSAAGRRPATSLAGGKLVVYKWLEIIDGRAIPKYSTDPPQAGSYEVVRP
jgi:soluble lytic murein transglycosylase-like protein